MERLQDSKTLSFSKRIEDYRSKVLSTFPPRLHRWLLLNFTAPERWFEARVTFTRSCALWSMVGSVVGLGDRHAENLLVDETNGEFVHVDFDCLFDKGLTLHQPEVVPFRLTPHIVDAMGCTGYEGVFRRSCEVSLHVLRQNKDLLMSVLDSFLHDPLVYWDRKKSKSRHKAKEKMHNIEERLRGIFNRDRVMCETPEGEKVFKLLGHQPDQMCLPLSVEGQVHRLIREATKESNLFLMYPGWAPYL